MQNRNNEFTFCCIPLDNSSLFRFHHACIFKFLEPDFQAFQGFRMPEAFQLGQVWRLVHPLSFFYIILFLQEDTLYHIYGVGEAFHHRGTIHLHQARWSGWWSWSVWSYLPRWGPSNPKILFSGTLNTHLIKGSMCSKSLVIPLAWKIIFMLTGNILSYDWKILCHPNPGWVLKLSAAEQLFHQGFSLLCSGFAGSRHWLKRADHLFRMNSNWADLCLSTWVPYPVVFPGWSLFVAFPSRVGTSIFAPRTASGSLGIVSKWRLWPSRIR